METKLDDETEAGPGAVVEEKRKLPRHRTLKAGHIGINRGGGGFDCRVRNLSELGACLEVASQIGIPEDFVLKIDVDHFMRPCHVIWRTATRMGVTFQTDTDAPAAP
jgi:hypothetical protein